MIKNLLSLYNKKRNFKKTSEPEGKLTHGKKFIYLIQKHAATRLHYDFRLELNGTLKSWAVTKGPSLDPQVKRLAVEVEDHPVAYGTFEGTIPKGEYGGGTVMLWDQGHWKPEGDAQESLNKGHLNFEIFGKRLKGSWSLIRMKNTDAETKNNWLLIKKDDQYCKYADNDKLLTTEITSITSGLSMEEIAGKSKKVWNGDKASAKNSSNLISTKTVTKKTSQNLSLNFAELQLATLSAEMPEGVNWIHEIKFDGYRSQAIIENGEVKIFTRNGLDWTDKYQSIAEELKKLPVKNAVLDGEIVALDENQLSNFSTLQENLKEGKTDNLQYYLFDILLLDDEKTSALPLIKRKEKLEKILQKKKLKNVFYSQHFKGDKNFLTKLCSLNYEGAISKLSNQPYRGGRSRDWLKTKCHKRQEFVIGGYTLQENKNNLAALLLGYYENEKLIYAGKVGTGFSDKLAKDILGKLKKIKKSHSSFTKLSTIGKKDAIFVEPELVCEVEFTQWTNTGALRHPSFQGLRIDKIPHEVHREFEISLDDLKNEKTVKVLVKTSDSIISSIKITHPERIIYPKINLTKLDLANYYNEVSDHILPHLENRLISVVRCPQGLKEECFFQRHENIDSKFIYEARINKNNVPYIYIKDKEGLLTLIQYGVIEIHAWNSKIDKVQKPDRLVFDLDPDTEIPWKSVVEAAADVKLRMNELGLESFLRTTGGKGLHIVIPIKPEHDFEVIKAFTHAFAQKMQDDRPEAYIVNMSKEKRKGKIFIDYLRNELTSTAITSFSVRARENATVALPISWEELSYDLDPQKFTMNTVPQILSQQKSDPWKDLWKSKQSITKSILKDFKVK